MQTHEIRHIADLINAVIDLEYFDELEEQEIFEHAVETILNFIDVVLPHPYKQLVVSACETGISNKMAEPLKLRLEKYCLKSIDLPQLVRDTKSRNTFLQCCNF